MLLYQGEAVLAGSEAVNGGAVFRGSTIDQKLIDKL